MDGTSQLPELSRAGVVDAGALAMFIFFNGFFRRLAGQEELSVPVHDLFAGRIRLNDTFQDNSSASFCVDAVLEGADDTPGVRNKVSALGESVVLIPDENQLKIHIHTPDPAQLRAQLASLGKVVQFADERIDQNKSADLSRAAAQQQLHLMTDAAGSFPRSLAESLGVSLLDSYIIAGNSPRPESLCSSAQIYSLMQAGKKVTTAQASTAERHQHYESICSQYGNTLYLCTGSAFTGNFAAATAWKKECDSDGLLTVLDTGAASGRLGLITLLTARFARQGAAAIKIIQYAEQLSKACTEYVFIDELRFLVAGGRVSRAGGFFGDLLHMKPIISPTGEGVQKMGVVRSRKGQLRFCLDRLTEQFQATDSPLLMLQYSDNRDWLETHVQPEISRLLPAAEILLIPLSLTSGVHMGPATWSLAHAPAS
jgi:DegV family protein with EDD domain